MSVWNGTNPVTNGVKTDNCYTGTAIFAIIAAVVSIILPIYVRI